MFSVKPTKSKYSGKRHASLSKKRKTSNFEIKRITEKNEKKNKQNIIVSRVLKIACATIAGIYFYQNPKNVITVLEAASGFNNIMNNSPSLEKNAYQLIIGSSKLVQEPYRVSMGENYNLIDIQDAMNVDVPWQFKKIQIQPRETTIRAGRINANGNDVIVFVENVPMSDQEECDIMHDDLIKIRKKMIGKNDIKPVLKMNCQENTVTAIYNLGPLPTESQNTKEGSPQDGP